MKVMVYSSPMRNGVYHTRECATVKHRDGAIKEVDKESIEKLGYLECKKCAKTEKKATKDTWRKSLKQMIEDGDV